jgi:hypothetical protein
MMGRADWYLKVFYTAQWANKLYAGTCDFTKYGPNPFNDITDYCIRNKKHTKLANYPSVNTSILSTFQLQPRVCDDPLLLSGS